jgi:hypothetical protein
MLLVKSDSSYRFHIFTDYKYPGSQLFHEINWAENMLFLGYEQIHSKTPYMGMQLCC